MVCMGCVIFVVILGLFVYYCVNSYNKNRRMNIYERDLNGKTVVITGCSAGLGMQTAMGLARMGAKVVCLNRDEAKSKKVIEEMLLQVPKGKFEHVTCNVADLVSVKETAEYLLKTYESIDLLVNNAGIMGGPVRESPQGFELQYATNFLGHFLLTHKLLPILRRSADGARVVFLSSVGHTFVFGIDWKYLLFKNTTINNLAVSMIYYSWSKLFCLLAAVAMQKRFGDDKVSFYAAAPGVINTNLFQHLKAWHFVFKTKIITKNVVEGCQTSLFCCTAPEDKLKKGGYHDHCAVGNRGLYDLINEKRQAEKLYEIGMEHIKDYM